MKVEIINNWKYKAKWSNLYHFHYNKDPFGTRHLLIGFFGFVLFVVL